MAVILLSLLCNHNNLMLKLHQSEKKVATLVKGGFILADHPINNCNNVVLPVFTLVVSF